MERIYPHPQNLLSFLGEKSEFNIVFENNQKKVAATAYTRDGAPETVMIDLLEVTNASSLHSLAWDIYCDATGIKEHEAFASDKWERLSSDDCRFYLDIDPLGDLCVTGYCHRAGEEHMGMRIRLDQIPAECKTREKLAEFWDDYVHDRNSAGTLIPKSEMRFQFGFDPQSGEPAIWAETILKDGTVEPVAVSFADFAKGRRTVEALEKLVVKRKKNNA